MRRRIYLTAVMLLALASVAVATYIAVQKTATQGKTAPKSSTARGAAQKKPATTPAGAPIRPTDPNRAPQTAVDQALYTDEEFFGVQASVMRPYPVALERVSGLIGQYPKDARLHLHAARLAERLSQFDRAAGEMVQYANLRNRSADALRRLADFYHKRALYTDEVKTLRDLAKTLPVNQRAPVYKRAANLVRSRSLREFKPADFFAELVAADSANIQPVKDYVEELTLSKQHKDALAVLTSFQPKFPADLAYFLKTRAQILDLTNDRRGAEDVYASAFDPAWSRAVASDYYDLLRRFGRYRIVRRGLQEQIKAGTNDLQTVARLFSIYAYEGNYEQAAKLLTDLEQRRAGKATPAPSQTVQSQAWTARELETAAAMFTAVGHYDQASRYLYTLYLTGGLQPASSQREDALYRLFKVMLDAAGTPTRVAAGDLSFYRDVAEVDQNPGFMNGVLSLILSGANPAEEFATQEKTAAGYFNRAFAYRIYAAVKQEYPESKYLGEMSLGIVNVFAWLGEHKLAIQTGREFQQRFPDSPSYADVSLRIADSYVALKDRAGERQVLAALLDRLARTRPQGTPLLPVASKRWSYGVSPQVDELVNRIRYNIEAYSDTYDPTDDKAESEDFGSDDDEEDSDYGSSGGEGADRQPTYSSVLERYVSSLAAEEKSNEIIAFFWGEIKKYPKEEGLYERFLRWLGQAQLINEQLKAYNQAIRQFDSNTWYHRLARWHVRQKRGRELARYSRQLIDVFDEEEITEYLLRFAGYGTSAAGDSLNWDERLAYELYSYARRRFPRNLFFVRGLLTYLAKHDLAQWEKLSAQSYFTDQTISEPYLAWLSKQNQLRDRYQSVRSPKSEVRSPTADPGLRTTDLGPRFTYRIFTADAAAWLSHHDEAIDAYRRLVALYPGQPQYADRLSDLTRSFGYQSDKYYEESAATYAKMAEIYPAEHSYRIKAGEVYAELGDFKRASEQWDKLIQQEPGERETYLEVATVYWDYYQFDQAIRVFQELRNQTGDPNIYAYRLGAVYEGKGDVDAAIAEYVKVLPEPGDGRDTVAKRLAQLARRKGLPEKIAAAYQRARGAQPADWQLVIGYATYLAERDQQADALALLRSEVDRSNDVAFLETTRDLFRAILRPEDEQQVLQRLAAVARDERESMMYRLQLAAFLERAGKMNEALSVIDRLTTDYPTNVGVVEESAKFYWRAGQRDRSLDLYKRTLARARGGNVRALTLQYARRQAEAGKLADAEATLRAYYNDNRDDAEAFAELARTLGAANKLAELAELYRSAFKDARESGLTGDEARERVASLRVGMIRALDSLGKYEDAVDQHIEIINNFPEDADRLAAAMDYAERRNLTPRLVAYYEKLTKEAFRNYRWQLALGRMYERLGNLAGASEQYRAAVANEPERGDLRRMLASTLARQQRYDEAIATLREGWALAGRDPEWLIEVAQIQVRQGNRDAAVQTLRQALNAKKEIKVQDRTLMASRLTGWGLNAEAVRLYEQAFADLARNLKDETVSSEEVGKYVRALVKVEPAPAVFQKVERLRAQFQAIADNSKDVDGYRARNIVTGVDQAMRTDFGRGVSDYATPTETNAVASAIRTAVANLASYGDREPLLRYLGIARGANLVEVEELIYTQIKDAAFNVRRRPEDTNYYNELRALVSFYNRHGAYTLAAEALAAEHARDPYKDRFDYQNQIATQYRLAGDRERELEALRVAYAGASGSLTDNKPDWVERYLAALYDAGRRDELARLTSAYSPYQLQLINFLIEKNEKALARQAIASANQSPAWVASRSGEVGLFLKDTSAETESFFRSALDIRAIGEMLGRRPDQTRVLVGDDWFVAARNYGYWLGLSPAREADSRNFVAAEVEGHPTQAGAQLELAAYYLDRKDATRAEQHNALAAELAPGDKGIAVMRGSVALAKGDRKAATDAWAAIITGRTTVEDAQLYLDVMADNGMLREALPPLENFIIAYVNRRKGDERASAIEAVKPLLREAANRAATDRDLQGAVASFLQATINRVPGDIALTTFLIEENLLPEAALASIYRIQHQRLSERAAAVFGTSQYEDGYYDNDGYFYPARALAGWRRRFLDYLIKNKSFDEARLLIATIKQEQADLNLALRDSGQGEDAYREDRYEWLPLASALIELRAGRDAAKAMAELRRYCGLEENTGVTGSLHERCLKAYALLVAEGKTTEAENLIYEAYRADARSRSADDASLAGLAEIEARRGRADEAGRLLKYLVERATDNQAALRLAAETAARAGRYGNAIEFRQQLARANPDDAANKLELARVLTTQGRGDDAMDRLAALVEERSTPNKIRAQAAEVVGEIARGGAQYAARAASLFEQRAGRGEAGALLARAAIAEATGRNDEAAGYLGRVNGGSLAAVARMKLGLIALKSGRDAEAVSHFERALYLDADGAMTDAIAFRAQGPRAQLVSLYSRTGRDLAALRLAEGDGDRRPLISAAVLNASGEEQSSGDTITVAFEPPLDSAQARTAGLKTIAELNTAASAKVGGDVLAALAQSASRLGQYDRAIAIEHLRASEATRPEEKAAIETRLAEIIAAQRAREQRLAALLRVDRTNATESIYAARVLGD